MRPAVTEIAIEALRHFGMDAEDIRSLLNGQRSKSLSECRAVVCWVLRKRHAWSYPEIARSVGYSCHTSAIDAVQLTGRRSDLLAIAETVLAWLPGANRKEEGRERTGAREIELEAAG